MSPAVAVTGAVLKCPFGVAPAVLNVLPTARVMVEGRPAASIADSVPMLNVLTFGMCNSLANPMVAAATAAALGALTPMPCVPAPAGPWVSPAVRTTVGGQPVLVQGSTCVCAYGGTIAVQMAGAVRSMAN